MTATQIIQDEMLRVRKNSQRGTRVQDIQGPMRKLEEEKKQDSLLQNKWLSGRDCTVWEEQMETQPGPRKSVQWEASLRA